MISTPAKSDKLGLKELVAIGVGGMVGGGIFSVLGLSIAISGHAAPLAFIIGGIIAMLTGMSYASLGLRYRDDGGSFTYLEQAFNGENIAGISGWLLIAGYIGTLALYAYTFGAYGSAMLGKDAHIGVVKHLLESLILLLFLGINLYGVKAAGETEDVIVMVKVAILCLFAVIGLIYVKPQNIFPVFNKGVGGVIMGAALIFVAYEGFELIPNAIHEMQQPEKDLSRSIIISITLTVIIYFIVSLVAVGNLTPADIIKYKEYALAVAAKPFMGKAGFTLIGLAALLSTASAINATLFGTARLGMVMAKDKDLPKVFYHRERTKDIPYISLIAITTMTIIFVNVADLTIISSFASSAFLLTFALINVSAIKLCREINLRPVIPVFGFLLSSSCWLVLIYYLARTNIQSLVWIGGFNLVVVAAELLFSQRRLIFKVVRDLET